MHDVLFIFIRDTQRIYISTYHRRRQSVADVTLEHIAFGYFFFFFLGTIAHTVV